MAEEEEVLDMANTVNSTSYTIDFETLIEEDNVIFFAIATVGLLVHALIIYTTVKSKRLRSRTNIMIMNWIAFEMVSHNILYPLLHYIRLYEYNFLLHLISGNVMFMTITSALLCLNVLMSDSVMMSNKTTFKEFLERFYAIQFTIYAIVLFWKMYTQHDIYMELLLILTYFISWIVLVLKVLYRQCHRFVKRTTLNNIEELRLHLATFFLVGKIVITVFGIYSVMYKSKVLLHLTRLWGLSGVYVIVLLIVKDINFKISLYEILGLNVKNPNDVDTMISEDKDGEDNLVETCIEN